MSSRSGLTPLAVAILLIRTADDGIADRAEKAAADLDFVSHVTHAEYAFGNILGQALGMTVIDFSSERHLSCDDLDLDVAGINVRMLRQAFIDVFLDPVIGALPVTWTTSYKPAALAPVLAFIPSRALPTVAAI